MRQYTIKTQVLSSVDFNELITEMQINNEIIGHIQQESQSEKPEVVFYNSIQKFPKEVLEEAIQKAIKKHPPFTDDTHGKN